jgi:putative addiction module component (TIGR02574 family)
MTDATLDIEKLTPEERLELIARLWASLQDADVPLDGDQLELLGRRLDRIERDGPRGLGPAELRDLLRERRRR